MNRRNFMKGLLATSMGGMAALSGNPFSPKIKMADAANGKTLVVLFQRGGCDGLNTVIPYTESRYYQLRPTLAIQPPSASPASAIDLDGSFGLHPALAALLPIHNASALAIMPTVHYPDASRSHFNSQHYIESAASSREVDGWLNRYLQSTSGNGNIRAIGFGNELAQALRGTVTVSSMNDLRSFSLGIPSTDQATLLANLSQVYDGLSQDGRAYRQLLNRFGSKLISDIENLRDIDAGSYVPSNGAAYPDHTTGKQMQQVAQLIKSGIGLEAVTLSIGGWDNHSDQGGGQSGGTQYNSHTRFAESIAAFYADMGAGMSDVVLLTCTEFGRTAEENGSFGTDHGWASTWFAMGGGIQGGIYGLWPGLEEDQLHGGRFLEMTIDYRDVFGDILVNHMAAGNLSSVLAGHTHAPVGLFT